MFAFNVLDLMFRY